MSVKDLNRHINREVKRMQRALARTPDSAFETGFSMGARFVRGVVQEFLREQPESYVAWKLNRYGRRQDNRKDL